MSHENDDASFPIIYIVGSNLLQNKLLALCLEKELTVECNCRVALTMKDLIGTAPERVCVYLVDCFKRETAALERVPRNRHREAPGYPYLGPFQRGPDSPRRKAGAQA